MRIRDSTSLEISRVISAVTGLILLIYYFEKLTFQLKSLGVI